MEIRFAASESLLRRFGRAPGQIARVSGLGVETSGETHQLSGETHPAVGLRELEDELQLDRRVEGEFGDADGASGVTAGLAEDLAQQL